MTVSSEALRTIEFREGWRGYNQVDVDVFLEETAAGVDALVAELAEAKVRAERAESRVPGVGSAPETDETVRRTLALAQRAADLVVGESKAVAQRIIADATLRAERIAAEATAAAAAAMERALLEARQAASAVSQTANEEHERALQAVRGQRLALESELEQRRLELDEVRELSSASRDRLQAILTDHLARLDRLESVGSVPAPPRLSAPAPGPSPMTASHRSEHSDVTAIVDVTELGTVTL